MKKIYTAIFVLLVSLSGNAYALDEEQNTSISPEKVTSNEIEAQSLDVHECERYPDRCPDYEASESVQQSEIDDCKWDPAKCKQDAEEAEESAEASYNNSRSNRSTINSDLEIDDCKWNPSKCKQDLKVERKERIDSLKEHFKVEQKQYLRLKNQFKPRVEEVFQRLSDDRYERVSQKIAKLIDKNQDNQNKTLITALLTLQELLDESR